MEFSQIVKSLRLERGWSQQEVADRARLVDTFIARVELRNDEALIFYNIREKGPHSRVRVRPEWWSPRDGTRTPKIIVLRDYVVLRIAV